MSINETTAKLIQSYLNQGLDSHNKGVLASAAQQYKMILKLQPKHFEALRLLSIVKFQQKDFKSSLNLINLALLQQPESAALLCNKGSLYKELGEFEGAIRCFSEAIKFDPRLAPAFNNRGVVLNQIAKYELATEDFKKACFLKPSYAEAYNNLGISFNALGRYIEAIESYNKAIHLNGKYAEAFYNRANAVAGLNNLDQAVSDYTHAIQIKERFAEAVLARGHVYLRQGKETLAESDFARILNNASDKTFREKAICTLLDFYSQSGSFIKFEKTFVKFRHELWGDDDIAFDKQYRDGIFKTGTSISPLKRRNRFKFLVSKLKNVQHLAGDYAECGCFRGLSSFLLCSEIRFSNPIFNGQGYRIFDSFEGLSVPLEADFASMDERLNQERPSDAIVVEGKFSATVDRVKRSLAEFPRIQYFKGWIPTAFPSDSEIEYKFVHVDVDLYQPTLDSFEYFWPRMVVGGVIVCDDFNWSGARRAVEEFSTMHNIDFEISPFNQAVFIKNANA